MTLISETSELAAFCARQGGADFIALDTEFLRDTTYWPKLCLVQIAGPEEAVAVDTLASKLDLAPLYRMLADESLLKVLHSARQDLEIFFHQTGKLPKPIFDTQVAAMVCGFGESVAYQTLARLASGGDAEAYALPRPMLNRPGFDFSFSGLKTAVMLAVREAEAAGELDARRADLAASFQQAVVDTLVGKSLKAAAAEGYDRIIVAGGVGANAELRRQLAERFAGDVYYPRLEFCTDNGAMIAVAGACRLADALGPEAIEARARWRLDRLSPPGAA